MSNFFLNFLSLKKEILLRYYMLYILYYVIIHTIICFIIEKLYLFINKISSSKLQYISILHYIC